jgi:carbon starvation protein
LALLAASSWLLKRQRQAWFTIIPAIFMVITTIAALLLLLQRFLGLVSKGVNLSGNVTLLVMDILCLGLALGVVGLAFGAFKRSRIAGASAEA